MRRWGASFLLYCFFLVAVHALVPQPASADLSTALRGIWNPAEQTPHPAVVQVVSPEYGAVSRGSGTLVNVDEQYGYVLTNWHVVRDAASDVQVIFPDGFRSAGKVLKTDADWDLALLMIWRPLVAPMKLSRAVPRIGDGLTIAGYGQGSYRAVRGRCSHYAAPDLTKPFDLVEVSIAARNGDSGGPIVNDSGELAGVLFGAGQGMTTGSHVGRVRWFLASAMSTRYESQASIVDRPSSASDTLLTEVPPRDARSEMKPLPALRPRPVVRKTLARPPAVDLPTSFDTTAPEDPAVANSKTDDQPVPRLSAVPERVPESTNTPVPTFSIPHAPATHRDRNELTLADLAGNTFWEQAKTLLAIIGLVAVAVRLLPADERN